MAAICDSCGWSGTSTQVANGRCPICHDFIHYESKPLQPAHAPEAIRATGGDVRLGPAIGGTERAHKVRVIRAGQRDTDTWVPKSIAETTREGVPPQTIVWAPRWFAEKENLL